MDFDISRILESWDYKAGQVMVRKFKTKDGRELIQLRVDLGLLQLNATGRPDGKRPMGHDSWFDFYLARLEEHRTQNGGDVKRNIRKRTTTIPTINATAPRWN